MITKLDLELAVKLANPRTIYHFVRIGWLRYKLIKQNNIQNPPHSLQHLKKTFHFLRQEKIVKYDGKYLFSSFSPPFPGRAFDIYTLRSLTWQRGFPLYPDSVNIAVTDSCPMKCQHCSSANRGEQSDLTTQEWFRIIEELQSATVTYIGITGGEPLLREDLEKIINHIDDRSISVLATCGIGLSVDRARALKKAGLFHVMVSLDHHTPEAHDKIRGYPGAFGAATQAIQNARSAGLYTIVQTVFTKETLHTGEFWEILKIAKELGAHEMRGASVRPAGRLVAGDRNILLSAEEINQLHNMSRKANLSKGLPKVSIFDEFESPTMFGCSAGAQHGYIDALGNVYPCDFVPLKFGNITQEAFVDIWARVRQSLGKPRRQCLSKLLAKQIASEPEKVFPISVDRSIAICEACRSNELPDYFKV